MASILDRVKKDLPELDITALTVESEPISLENHFTEMQQMIDASSTEDIMKFVSMILDYHLNK